ncbi:hypothetical protein OF83DRAFT_198725 [Amylostereum chailletii]|nr:hypothetical protein OF83DRAFT_198725 [Amylostereum chailletii]
MLCQLEAYLYKSFSAPARHRHIDLGDRILMTRDSAYIYATKGRTFAKNMAWGLPCLFAGAALLGCLLSVSGLSSTLLPCQLQETSKNNPLAGCPQGTIFVSASEANADFTRVQDAISSLNEQDSAIILIGAGEYHETVNVTRVGALTLLVVNWTQQH